MKTIHDINVSQKKVILRVDYNVPMDYKLKITDDARIKKTLPTLKHLIDNNAAIIIASHLGRPKGRPDNKLSLSPVAKHLAEMLGMEVKFICESIGEEVEKVARNLKPKEILFLENLRFHKEEEENDKGFAKQLAELCDIYVNDAFGLAHRAHASVSAIVEFAKESCAGYLLAQECENLTGAVKNPERPLVVIIGGAKVTSKVNALKNILNYADRIIIGGVAANTFLKASGFDMCASEIDNEAIQDAKAIIKTAAEKKIPLHLPVDLVAAKEISSDTHVDTFPADKIPKEYMALDVGSKSLENFRKALTDARTIIWSGALGVFEKPPFDFGTNTIGKIITQIPAFTIIGGGDTGAAMHKMGLEEKISYISTGGGAFLSFLAGKPMPAIDALNNILK